MMDIDKKLIMDQEQIDIDDEMAEDDDAEHDDNSWLGSLGALLSPCRPIYHSTGQPLYQDISDEAVKAEVISRLAHELKAQKEAILRQAMQLHELSSIKSNNDSRIHFENADVTITKIERKSGANNSRLNSGIKSDDIQPISIANPNNGNTKPNYPNGIRSHMKKQLSKGPMVQKQVKKYKSNNSAIQEKGNVHQDYSSIIDQANQEKSPSASPVIKKLKEDLRLAKSAIRTCPICSKDYPDLNNHVKVAHGVQGVVCPHCSKILAKTCTLSRHIEQVHLNLQIHKPAKCEECGKVFSKKGHLDRHIKTIHMGMKEESQPCPHCGKIFSTKSSLEPHILMVHKGVRKKCPDCGKVLSDLWKHMRTIHGHYRRRVKIPKEEALLQMTSLTTSAEEDANDTLSSTSSLSSPPSISTPPPLKKLSNKSTPVIHNVGATVGNLKDSKTDSVRTKLYKNKKDLGNIATNDKSDTGNKQNKTSTEDSDTISKQSKQPVSLNTSKNKRKNSLPLKVKMPFKISKKNSESATQMRKQGIRQSDDDVDL